METSYINQKGFTFGPPDRQDVGVAGGEGRVVRANSIVLSSCIEVRDPVVSRGGHDSATLQSLHI